MIAVSDRDALAGMIAIDGVQLYREVLGAGHPLVLLHAGIADCRMWEPQVDALAQHFRVIRYDARGFGRSAPARGEYSPRADLLALLAAHGIERAHLVGLSLGGTVALDVAIAHPEVVAALVLASARPSGLPPSPRLREAWDAVDETVERGDIAGANEMELQMWVDGPWRGPGAVDPAVRQAVGAMNGTLLAGPDDGTPIPLAPPAVERLDAVGAPTLVIAGEQDQSDVLTGAERIAASVPGARLSLIPDTAHMVNMEQPERFNELVVEFLLGVATR